MARGSTICIAGMHRSGTSLTAAWLQRCGLPIHRGHRSRPQVGNLQGEFEDEALRRIHARSIARQVPGSAGWRVTDPVSLSLSLIERTELRRQIWLRDRRFGAWGFKDPRSACFLDEWVRARPTLVTLVVWRPEAEVRASLLRRASRSTLPVMQVDAEQASATWTAYAELLVAHAARRSESTLVVPLGDLVRDNGWVVDRLRELSGAPLRHVPITDVYDPAQLHGCEHGRPSSSRVSELESRLSELSGDRGTRR